ncbi:hypothetical protein TWF481_009054 [Arthrobotrys musiformis]|uniref:Uncharacterized protein n=1 Tax=Arthrobotrys musiformis TaxID=47236 RepID=A0AAV9W2L0_9PEZI
MTRRHIPNMYKISNDEIIKLIMNSTDPRAIRARRWFMIIAREFIKRGAPKNEETTTRAKAVVGRVRKIHPSLGDLVYIIRSEKKKKNRAKSKPNRESEDGTQETNRELESSSDALSEKNQE